MKLAREGIKINVNGRSFNVTIFKNLRVGNGNHGTRAKLPKKFLELGTGI
jgi:hypothetical protein